MSNYTVMSAAYANAGHTSAIIQTEEAGAVAISSADTPDLWAQLHASGLAIEDFSIAPIYATLEEAKAAKQAEIKDECDKEVEVIRATYPDAEVLSWAKQETEARALVADPNAETVLIDSIAEGRSMDRMELATRIIAKADAFAAISGAAIGKRQLLEEAIAAATSIEDVIAISWDTPLAPEEPAAPDKTPPTEDPPTDTAGA
jgi:hypothetical protein